MPIAKLRDREVQAGKDSAGGRESVLAAALESFAAQGFHGTSMRDIAARADMSISAAYYYFPSKADLLRHIMVSVTEDLIAILETARDTASDTPAARLAAIVRAYVRLHTERQTESFIGTSELRSLSADDRASVVALHDRVSDIFKTVIADGCRSGQFDCPHPAEATRAIATMCTAVAGWYRASGPHNPQTIADRYATLALRLVGSAAERR
ncbi:TetR/AcrR family transcriptional regulator [Reyranella sp. CPCC 100927]|uniref:TetR/AcrR family transcriptional regulator n=1 Tax=Reyranella sp. CPCC 100927 TaxID=2599616 RepID=UPI0011B72F80|nr:TetR/AcrR family transcriptional regulator [Reyranella sp. CPCC 100927]TWT12981.1 TetR/AcrR family transcriptional regulator [Reyranella sp. CPCC 100927]